MVEKYVTLKNNTRFVGGSRITATQGIILFTDGQFSGPGARDILPTMLGLMDEGIHITLIGKSYPNNTTCTVKKSVLLILTPMFSPRISTVHFELR